MQKKYKLSMPVLVEGKYDKNTLLQIFDATVITLGGFAVFNSKEKQVLIRKIAGGGIILLTDSDGGGKQIRSFINGILPKEKIFNAYIPQIEGKEKRKDKPSRAGLLGVEGMEREVLVAALTPFIEGEGRVNKTGNLDTEMLTKVDFFCDKLTGYPNSSERRAQLALYFGLPSDMTANALIEALNIITDKATYRLAVDTLFCQNRPDNRD